MIRSINTLNRSMNILQNRLENTSANIANVKTPGYKFQEIVQTTLESKEMINYNGGKNRNRRAILGDYIFGNEIDETYINFDQGVLYETNKDTDYAIEGNGFFTIELDNGQRAYTRNGNFRINEEGNLTTMEGYLVLGGENKGNIAGANSVLTITDFTNYSDLESIGNNLFISNNLGFIMNNPAVREGYLESSNVRASDEIVRMIQTAREFESHQKLLHAADETLSKAVNEVGRV